MITSIYAQPTHPGFVPSILPISLTKPSMIRTNPTQVDSASTLQQDLAIKGRVMLANGQEYACKAQHITVRKADIVTTCPIEVGQIAICYLENIGILPGKCSELIPQGFVFAYTLPENRWGRIAARVEWHLSRASKAAELRGAPRIVPLHRSVEVRLGEHISLTGQLVDISLSGAAIKLDGKDLPFPGAKVRVGSRYASVVRHIASGIAVEFVVPLSSDTFDERVRP